jgi:DNA-binding response OmpR family regulator
MSALRHLPALLHTGGVTNVLIVDDEPIVRDVVARYLMRDGFTIIQAADGETAREILERETPALVVLDVMLPGLDGLDLCRWIRARSDVPVILLTARGDESDRIVGLELGADDYVTKPFSPRELAVRVRAILRRTSAPPPGATPVQIGSLVIDPVSRTVTNDGEPLRLTLKEFDLLWLLASSPNRVFSREELMRRVWGYEASIDTGTLTVHVRRLREKIEVEPSQPRHLETVWGAGYRLRP